MTDRIVVVTEDPRPDTDSSPRERSSPARTTFVSRLRSSTTYSVSVTKTGTDLATVTGSETAGVVCRVNDPSIVRRVLASTPPDVPTVVVPSSGCEKLASVAYEAGTTTYVPSSGDADPVDRTIDVVESENGGDEGGEASPDSTYARLLAETLPDEAFVIDEEGTYHNASLRADSREMYDASEMDLMGRTLHDIFATDTADELLQCVRRTLDTGRTQSIEYDGQTVDGVRRFDGRVAPLDERIEGRRGVMWFARDITDRARRERSLKRQRERLEILDRISTIIGGVIQRLVEAPTREAIERDVCEQLVDSELYHVSWIGEPNGAGGVSYRTGAGDGGSYLEQVRRGEYEESGPAAEVLESGSTWVSNRMQSEPGMPPEIETTMCEHDIHSAAAIPIVHDETVYGVLAVLSRREAAFDDRELAAFSLLGETIGFTINAVMNRRLLFADSVVELELHIRGGDSFSFHLSERYDCSCTMEWAGTTSGGRLYQYVTAEGIDSETVREEANDHPSIEEFRLIHGGKFSCTFELRLRESGVRTLSNHGATIRNVTVDDGKGTCLVEIPRTADVREIVDALRGVYERTELVARREIDRPVRTAAERRQRIMDRLTDRQLTALRIAYYGGFFDWPRGSTGEEVADAMDVSAPTMHQHLRKGLSEILTEFFESPGG